MSGEWLTALKQRSATVAGVTVKCLDDPRLALGHLVAAQARGAPFDLAILDQVMPHLDGVGLARTIRAHPLVGRVPLMLFSSADLMVTAQP